MKRHRLAYTLIMTIFPFLLCTSCNSVEGDKVTETVSDSVNEQSETEPITVSEEETVAEPEPVEVTEPTPKPTNAQSPSHGGRETLYISTYGANGKVWGHVTMNGKTGRGTIHDDDENSYSITVTRHGGELFGTDQNGRQYVFQL